MKIKNTITLAKSSIDFIRAEIKFLTLLIELIDLRGLKILMTRSDLRFIVPNKISTKPATTTKASKIFQPFRR